MGFTGSGITTTHYIVDTCLQKPKWPNCVVLTLLYLQCHEDSASLTASGQARTAVGPRFSAGCSVKVHNGLHAIESATCSVPVFGPCKRSGRKPYLLGPIAVPMMQIVHGEVECSWHRRDF